MSVNALSGHGTLIARNGTTIAELGDIQTPALSRNEFDATTQQEDIDSYVLGVFRRGALTVQMNFIPKDGTHDHQTGLIDAMITKTMDQYEVTFPDGPSPTVWLMSGQVQAVNATAPVDGKLSASVTIRFSGAMYIGGVLIS